VSASERRSDEQSEGSAVPPDPSISIIDICNSLIYAVSMKKKTKNINKSIYIFALIILIVGFAAGYFANNLTQMKPATAQEIEQAKNEIADIYRDKSVAACWRVNDGPNLASEKYELTYRNIQINQRVNRAIITDCSEYSTLLAKNSDGKWVATSVNITNFNRVNPVWQKECGIEDITVADDVVRPENSTIDETNLEKCKQLNQQ
jgi:hypothetical protein